MRLCNHSSDLVKKLRKLYNSIKHHGTIYIKGLGANFTSLAIGVNGGNIKTLGKEEISIGDIESLLWDYHQKFQVYFNSLIQLIMPEDYLNTSITWGEMITATLEMKAIVCIATGSFHNTF